MPAPEGLGEDGDNLPKVELQVGMVWWRTRDNTLGGCLDSAPLVVLVTVQPSVNVDVARAVWLQQPGGRVEMLPYLNSVVRGSKLLHR